MAIPVSIYSRGAGNVGGYGGLWWGGGGLLGSLEELLLADVAVVGAVGWYRALLALARLKFPFCRPLLVGFKEQTRAQKTRTLKVISAMRPS